MKFYSCNLERPVRLSEQTRLFAHESLNHKYGLEARACPCVPVDDTADFDALPPCGRQLNWAPDRLASAHGHKAGEVLAGNMSPPQARILTVPPPSSVPTARLTSIKPSPAPRWTSGCCPPVSTVRAA